MKQRPVSTASTLKLLLAPLLTVGLIVLLAVVALGANPFANQTVGPFDLLTHMPGWADPAAAKVRHFERSDVLDWQLPQWQWGKQQLQAGELPLWNWTRGGGVPGFFDLSTAMATPGFALFAAFEDTAAGFYWSTLMRLVVAGLGMYLLLRLELSRLPSLFGALTFMLSGFLTAWLYWPHSLTLMWFPWLLFALLKLLSAPSVKRWYWLVAAALMLALGGFPSVAAYCFYAAGLSQLVFGFAQGWSPMQHVRHGVMAMAALLVALALAAPWIAGLYEVLNHVDVSYRGYGPPGDMGDLLSSLLPGNAFDSPRVEQARYVGTVALLLALLGVVQLWQRSSGSMLGWIGLVLTLFAMAFLGGLVPKEWVAHVPAINNSPWGRLSSVLGMGLALLAASGLATFSRLLQVLCKRLNYSHHRVSWLLAGLLLVQAVDQLNYFREFNGPVDARLVYPTTDAIDQVLAEQQPLQSAVVDKSFLVAGTLNYFGLGEWLAHGLKAEHERQLLQRLGDNLFATPTASMFPLTSVDMASPVANALAVRHFVGRGWGGSINAAEFGLQGHQPAPPLPDVKWRQNFSLASEVRLYGIELTLATYSAESAPAALTLTLFDGASELTTLTLPAQAITDNAQVYFEFTQSVQLVAGDYQFALVLGSFAGAQKLTAWSAPASDRARLDVNGVPSDLSIKFNLVTEVPEALGVNRFNRRISVIENQVVTSNAYFIEHLDTDPADIVYSSATRAELRPDQSIVLNYQGNAPGWVVLPVRNQPGWQATSGSKALRASAYLGVLPAFAVSGPTRIHYGYDSPTLAIGFWVAAIAMLLLLMPGLVVLVNQVQARRRR